MSKNRKQVALFQYVFDASSLIDIERQGKMKFLRKNWHVVLIPERVAKEVDQPNTPLYRYLKRYPNIKTSLSTQREINEYLKFVSQSEIDEEKRKQWQLQRCVTSL